MITKKIGILFIIIFIWSLVYSADYLPNPDGWNYHNYLMTDDEDELWDIYSKAFLGVSSNRATAGAEDITFFDLVISMYGGKASCFGMSLLSLICYHEGGHLGVCGPVYPYEGGLVADATGAFSGPDMDIVRESISIMHLRQLSRPMIEALIDLFNDSNWNDPEYAYNQIKTSIASKDFPLISFMPSSLAAIEAMGQGAEAHTVVPYKCEDTGTHYRIYIYDPNFPYSTNVGFYTGATLTNYIDIEKAGWTHDWKYPSDYDYAPASYGWDGSTSGPWTFLATNVSNAKYKNNHPGDVGFLTGQIGTLIFSSGGTASKITDEKGKNFYKEVGGAIEFEKDPAKKTNNIIRWPFFHGETGVKEMYFVKDMAGKSYDIQVDAKTKGYSCEMLLNGNTVTFEVGKCKAGKDNLKFKSIGSSKQVIEISSDRKLKDVSIELYVLLPDRKTERTFRISDLEIKKNSPVKVKLIDRSRTLQVENPEAPIEYMLELTQKHKGEEIKLAPQRITTPAGQLQKLQPLNWKELKKGELNIRTKELIKEEE